MYTIYNSIQELCEQSGVKPGKMCNNIGISRSILTDLKTGRKKSINTDTAKKIADYFNVSVDRVLGAEQKENADPQKGTGTDTAATLTDMEKKVLNLFHQIPESEWDNMLLAVEVALRNRGLLE